MRHPVHGRLLAILAILLSSSWLAAADGKLDLSTPRKTATAFAMALQRGDLATLRMVAVGSGDDFKLMQSVTGMTAAANQLNDAATARFGAEDGKKFAKTMGSAPDQNDIPRQIAESDEKVEGDSASITMKGTQAANAINLKKVGGEWKVDLAKFPRREEIAQQAPILDAGMKVLVQGAADVRAGKYKSPDEAGQDIQRQMIMVMTSVGRQQMQAAPARPPTTQGRN